MRATLNYNQLSNIEETLEYFKVLFMINLDKMSWSDRKPFNYEVLKSLPRDIGVYKLYFSDSLIYIGETHGQNFYRRLNQFLKTYSEKKDHISGTHSGGSRMVKKYPQIENVLPMLTISICSHGNPKNMTKSELYRKQGDIELHEKYEIASYIELNGTEPELNYSKKK